MVNMVAIAENVKAVKGRVMKAAAAAGREGEEITVVAVTKNRSPAEVRAAAAAGLTAFGENRVQEALEKVPALSDLRGTWHLIGHLQTNKAAKAVTLFDVIQSVDSRRLADELERRAGGAEKEVEVFVEVNTSGEASKFGCEPTRAEELAAYVAGLRHLTLTGLMTIGPLTGGAAGAAKSFAALRELFQRVAAWAGPEFRYLSMGMSDDFEIAIAEGANMVRIGRALFDRD